jgi:hypothetical protein
MPETLDDADDRLLREFAIPQECPLSFGEPVRLHAEQYSLRMCLCFPVHSTTLRLPVSKRLNCVHSGLGQAKAANEVAGFASPVAVTLGVRTMAGLHALDNEWLKSWVSQPASAEKPRQTVPRSCRTTQFCGFVGKRQRVCST